MRQPLHNLKASLYQMLPAPLLYRQGPLPNIILFSSRRGGSTHLAELIATDPGMRYVDQPFDLRRKDTIRGQIKSRHLPPKPMSQFIDLQGSEAAMVERYLALLLRGGLRGLSAPRFSRKNRTVLKIVNALPLVDWMAERFPVAIVYLLRHPIAQSLSVLRNDWDNTSAAFLQSEYFVNNFMSRPQHQASSKILANGSPLEKAILNWALENIVPLRHARRVDLMITYEELVLNAEAMIGLLCKRLTLRSLCDMQESPSVPSASSGFSSEGTLRAIANKDKTFLINKWMSSLSDDEKNAVQQILDTFGIDEYQAGSSLPHARLLQFPTTAGQTGQPTPLAEMASQ